MWSRIALALAFALSVGPAMRVARGEELTAEEVKAAIDRGVAYLKGEQNRVQGNWPEYSAQPGGITSLCALALLAGGVEARDPQLQQALAYLRALDPPNMTYATSLETMVFCTAEPKKDMLLIRRNVRWLEKAQIKSGPNRGMWPYSDTQGGGDNSNTQFALLALFEAQRVGVDVDPQTWRLALAHWTGTQRPDGSWGYRDDAPGTGSMTCAGITSIIIAAGQIHPGDARWDGETVQCCGSAQRDDHVERALAWLGRRDVFRVTGNPGAPDVGGGSRLWTLYYLYGLERVGRLTARRFIGQHDWYREGAAMLVGTQDRLRGYWKGTGLAETDERIATSMALLFLSKGRWPVLMSRLKHEPGEDWNLHRGAPQSLVFHVEKKWGRSLAWQIVDPRIASVDDLLYAPVLFINGREGLKLSPDEKANLRQYVDRGGFIFAENCCGGEGFDRDFRALVAEIFPETRLRLLPPDHPVWYAEERVDPKYVRPLWGIDACCRTSIVYCPENLSCHWELAGVGRRDAYPPDVQAEIDATLAMGVNVLAYATNRELKDKPLAVAGATERAADPVPRGTLYVAKLSHAGGSDDAPAALGNLLAALGRETNLSVSGQKRLLAAGDEKLAEYAVLFVHGRRDFRLDAADRKALAAYLERGGFIFADSICASPQFADAFRREMRGVLAEVKGAPPETRLERISPEHPLFTSEYRGFDIRSVTLRDPQVRGPSDPLTARMTQIAPLLEGVELDGRYAVIFSPYDLSCALENLASLDCKGYVKADAAKIGINVVLYALQQ
jgi:hypothetical protein